MFALYLPIKIHNIIYYIVFFVLLYLYKLSLLDKLFFGEAKNKMDYVWKKYIIKRRATCKLSLLDRLFFGEAKNNMDYESKKN